MNFNSLENVVPSLLCSEKKKKTERVSYLNQSTLQSSLSYPWIDYYF